jgi:anti-sigma B factor antagonist
MGSQSGTLINNVPIREETRLKPGDMLRVGPLVFEVVPKASPAAANSPSENKPAAATEDSILDWLAADTVPVEATGGEVAKSQAIAKAGPIRTRSYRHLLIKDVDDVAVVYFAKTKRLSARDYERVINELFALVDCEGYQRIVLNFSDVEYIHSTALARLAEFHGRLKATGGALRLCNIRPVLRELLEAAQYHSLLDIRDDEPSALHAFA